MSAGSVAANAATGTGAGSAAAISSSSSAIFLPDDALLHAFDCLALFERLTALPRCAHTTSAHCLAMRARASEREECR